MSFESSSRGGAEGTGHAERRPRWQTHPKGARRARYGAEPEGAGLGSRQGSVRNLGRALRLTGGRLTDGDCPTERIPKDTAGLRFPLGQEETWAAP